MANEPVDLKLYCEVHNILHPPASKAPSGGVSKSGSLFCPIVPVRPDNDYDEVCPKLFLGNRKIVKDGQRLQALGVTHLVNASMGPKFNQTNTSQEFYQNFNITFHGIAAMDTATFQILPFLRDAADFIDQALGNGGIVYVHCQEGVSRSATVVLAYLMLKKNVDLLSAAKELRSKRLVHPNDGFIKQLCRLQAEINGTAI